MLTITLYSRKGDPSSAEVRDNLESLTDRFPHRLVEVDVDSDPILKKNYGERTPVIEVGPYSLKSPFDKQKLMMTLGAANDRRSQLDRLGREDHHERVHRAQSVSRSDRVIHWMSKHYLALLNLFMLLYFGLPILAPVFMKVGAQLPASVIYTLYKPLCHQFAFRSFFLFGEQPYYPLAEADVQGVKTFEQATGISDVHSPNGLSRLSARQFVGNESVGYKMALCERDIAIYGGIFLFGVIFALSGRRIKPLHWVAAVLIGVMPIGLDGFSQLFSQMEWTWLSSIIPYRESTPFLRVLTGGLFGIAVAWFTYPLIEESMSDTRQFFIKKFASIKQNNS